MVRRGCFEGGVVGELAGCADELGVGCERTILVFYMSNWVISREVPRIISNRSLIPQWPLYSEILRLLSYALCI